MRRIPAYIAIFAGLVVGGDRVAAQDIDPTTLEPIDQNVADLSDLSASLRAIDPGLAPPSGFDRVYRVPGSDGLVMRANGGLYAVFPRSRYDFGPAGPVAVVPDGTVFYIGAPPPQQVVNPGSVGGSMVSTRMDSIIDARIGSDGERPSIRAMGVRPAVMSDDPGDGAHRMSTDEAYRRSRLRELLFIAARAERYRVQAARGPSSSSEK